MSLNLKDDETVALVTEVADRLGLTKTGAVREMAREKLSALAANELSDMEARRRHAIEWLEREVWPHNTNVRHLTKDEEEEILGYNEMTP